MQITLTGGLIGLLLIVSVVNLVLLVVYYLRRSGERGEEDLAGILRGELRQSREDSSRAARELRDEVTTGLKASGDSSIRAIGEMAGAQRGALEGFASQVKGLTDTTESRLNAVRNAIDVQLKEMQESNAKKLDEIRKTVDEQLQGTLEKRLRESFLIVSDQLEAVQRGLGEMQTLATGVGDLKRVLTNINARGTWAEVQLGAILQQMLAPDQYAENVRMREDSSERVEYAIRLPGHDGDPNVPVWLPVDSKFPQEAYFRLLQAVDAADPDAVQAATAELGRAIRVGAATIHDKYIAPPKTTDFAIMFLPTEGLYSEVVRQAGLIGELQLKYRVMVAGPTTLAALLNSLQMGFKTLAIQRRASEVWQVLGSIKTEFLKFTEVLARLKRQLETATRTIDESGVRTRAMERRLRDVEQLPAEVASEVLRLPNSSEPFNLEEADENLNSLTVENKDHSLDSLQSN